MMPRVILKWKRDSNGLDQTEVFDDGAIEIFEADQAFGAEELIPKHCAIDIDCQANVGDESQLAELLAALRKCYLSNREVRHWSYEAVQTRLGGVGHRDIGTLLGALPRASSVSLCGVALPMLNAIASSDWYRARLKSLSLRIGAQLRDIALLQYCEALESIEISGANNVVPPWDLHGFKGLDSLVRIVLSDIPALQEYRKWIAPRSFARPLPAVFIGAVYLPNHCDDIELGSHVRFLPESFEYAKSHWLRLVPTYVHFTMAAERGATKFQLNEKCSAPEFTAVLSNESSITELDCRACVHLPEWWPSVWLPTESGLGGGSETEVKLLLPNLRRLRGAGVEVDSACDDFVRKLQQLFGDRNGQTTIEIEGEVAARLCAWQWLLEATSSRVSLALSSTGAVHSPVCGGYCAIDLGQRSHLSFCRLLAQQGPDSRVPENIRVVGEISTAQIDFLRELLTALPKSQLHLAVQCHGGAEFALEEFFARFHRRVELSKELEATLLQLNFEKEEYLRAAKWASFGGAI